MNDSSFLTILLIDDSATDRSIFRHYLQQDHRYSYLIVEFETATQAMAWCQEQTPDVILLDFLLPDSDGLQFLEQFHSQPHHHQCAVLMLTGRGDEKIAVSAMKNGAQDYLVKNHLNAEILQYAIHHAIERMYLTHQLEQSREQQLIAAIALRIRQSLQLQEILDIIAKEVCECLGADRVLVYQFHPDQSGIIVAESVNSAWKVSLGTQIEDTCFQQGAGRDYAEGKKRAINNIYEAGLTDCHIQLLEEFQVQANLVVPILVAEELWGLLIAHQCSGPRQWKSAELELLDQLGVQISIAIQQASAYEQLQTQLRERKRAEESLRESEERFRNTFEQAAVGIAHVSLNGQFIRLNQRFCDIAGYPKSELISLTFQDITHPEDLAGHLAQLQMLLAGEISTYSLEKRYICKDGSTVWINLTVSLIRDVAGNPEYLISVIEDISEQICTREALKQLNQELEARVEQRTAALQASEGRYQRLTEVAPVGIFRINAFGKCIYINHYLCQMAGKPVAELLGTKWLRSIYSPDRDRLLQQWFESSKQGKIYQSEGRLIHTNGKIIWFYVQVLHETDPDGNIIGYVGTLTDISDRKQIEENLRNLSLRLTLAVKSANIGIWDWDLIHEAEWDDQMYELYGFSRDHPATYADWLNAVYPDDRLPAETAFQEAVRGEREFDTEFRIIYPDQSIRFIKTSALVQRNHQGVPQRMVGINYDITSQKQVEAALRESEHRYATLAEVSPVGIFRLDTEGKCVYVNQRWCEMTAKPALEALGMGWVDILHLGSDRPIVQLLQVFGERKLYRKEARCLHYNGSVIWFDCQVIPDRDPQGEIIGYVGTITDITDRKQVEAALRDSERRYATLAEAAPVAIFRLDALGNCVYVNERWSEITGKPTDTALGTGWVHTLYPERCHQPLTSWFPQLWQKGTYRSETEYLRPDGRTIWLDCQALAETNPFGIVIGYVGTITDITEPKKTEEQLRNLSERLTLAIRSGGFGIWEYDFAQGRQIWDQRMYEIYGISLNDFSGNLDSWLNFIHPDDRDEMLATIDKVLYERQEYNIEFRIIQPRGDIRYIKAYGLVNRDEQGQPVWMIGVNMDITERKQAEADLIRNRDLREVIFNESTDALFLVDPPSLLTVDCNRRAVELFEAANKAELVGIEGAILQLRPFTAEESANMVAQMQTKGYWSQELEYVTRQGKTFWGNIAAKPINIAGQTLNLVRVTDISEQQAALRERQQAEEQLWQTNQQLANANVELARATRLKDEFLANMSHELRTPLNAILGMSEGFLEGVFGEINQSQKKAIATIERSGKHLLELINDILDLSKIESGKLELQISDVSVRSLCDGSLAFIQQMAQKKSVHLSTIISLDIDSIQVDDRRLRQVLINLLSNAVKFTPEGGSVTLKVWLEAAPDRVDDIVEPQSASNPGQICFCIIDTGIGIAAENIDKLFQPFTQLDSSLNRNYNGTGLGLALVKRIVALHGGTVSVTSQMGQGSSFTVRIPYHPSTQVLTRQIVPALSTYRLPKDHGQVLIIEDCVTAAEQLTRYLREMGKQFVVYPQGEGAIEEVLRLQPALIILDLQLPNLSGWQVLNQLKLHPQTKEIPVIITSVVDEQTQGLAQGAYAYLVKPITRNQIQTILEKLESGNEPILPTTANLVATSTVEIPVILLAEDNQANIDTISGYLESRGYQLILAENGQQALELAQSNQPDIIIMDIQMPGMSGLEAIQAIREHQQLVDVPIIALTALAMPSDRTNCLAAGANEYLTKPVKLKQLALTIQQLLSK